MNEEITGKCLQQVEEFADYKGVIRIRISRKNRQHNGTYPWLFVTQLFHSGQPSHGGGRKTFEVMTLGAVASLLA